MVNVIYKLECTATGKSYIGKAVNFNKRWKQHISNLLSNGKHPLYTAIAKYGLESINIEFLEENLPIEDLDAFECLHISKHVTLFPAGYNLTTGGTGGDTWKHSTEESIKSRKAKYANKIPWNKGVNSSEDPRILAGTRNGNYGNPAEFKGNTTTFKEGMYHTFYGKTQTKETVTKRVATAKANESYVGRGVFAAKKVVNIETGEVYQSISHAASITGLNRDQIGHSCRRRGRKYPYRFVD